MFSINELQYLSFFTVFASNYDDLLSFDLPAPPTNDYYSDNIMNSQISKNVLIESLTGSAAKLKVTGCAAKFYNH
jgi:hypothetical protein